jgi:hypothetical protein
MLHLLLDVLARFALIYFSLIPLILQQLTNPLDQITAAIHVYSGDFFAVPRSEWDPQTFEERAFDLEHAKRVFEESNQRLRAAKLGIAG